jgi:predicted phage tail protein
VRDGTYKVIRGKPKGGMQLGPDELYMAIKDEVHIYPITAGRSKGGGKAILGILLLGVAIFMTGGIAAAGLGALVTGTAASGTLALSMVGTIAAFGAVSLLGGVAMMLSPTPGSDYGSREDTTQSFLFNGVQNTAEQGGPIPLIYGRFMVGSKVVSAAVTTEDISASTGTSTDGSYGGAGGGPISGGALY